MSKILVLICLIFSTTSRADFPAHWWKKVPAIELFWWEISPDSAIKNKELIVSKRNELGILSNFAHTPFTFRGKTYQSIEGFWQMMLYPENKDDPRFNNKVRWEHTREEVSQMVGIDAKIAGLKAEKNMEILKIDWVTFEGKKMQYRSKKIGLHYDLILSAMLEKYKQNAKVQKILHSTKNLILKPDHHSEKNAPLEWDYTGIWMKIRDSQQ
jgi:predicted NAD-dependent protein-ADP-ribosyltransferase YbiA (DUF1768 family)